MNMEMELCFHGKPIRIVSEGKYALADMSNDSLIGTSQNRISNIACQHNLAHSHISQGHRA